MKRPALTSVVRRGLGSIVGRAGAHLSEDERRAMEWANAMKNMQTLRRRKGRSRKRGS